MGIPTRSIIIPAIPMGTPINPPSPAGQNKIIPPTATREVPTPVAIAPTLAFFDALFHSQILLVYNYSCQ